MIVGTAGHIDHGKTSLLQALTGQAGDRRREERERGMTIDLGYVYAALEPGAALTGFIDVPGHERFTHNMLAGAQGIDLVLLVVAADDGVMPQTREHLAIVELLGIPRALIAISKCDRVDSARVQAVREQIDALLAPGPYAGAPQIPLSSVTGEGIETLRQALLDAQHEVVQRSTGGGFRLAIDRAFSVAGAGIVVTGTALSGQVAVGDTLMLSPQGKLVRVRGLHAQNQAADNAMAGQRVALNLSAERLALEQIHRGHWLVAEWLHAPTQRLDIRMSVLASESRSFEHFQPVHVHLGTQDVTGRVALLEGASLAPGEQMFAQLLVNVPVLAVKGDRLILRDQSAQRTHGGGQVLDPFAPARHRRSPERLAQLQALSATNSLEAALPALLANSDTGLDPLRLERQFNRSRETWELPDDVRLIDTRQGPLLFSAVRWEAQKTPLLEHLARFHQLEPDQMGPDRDRLRRFAGSVLERSTFISLLDELLASGAMAASGPWLHLPDHQVRLSEDDEALWHQLQPLFEQAGFDPPWVRDLAKATGHDEAAVRLLLRKMARLGLLHQIVRDLFYTDTLLRRLAAMLVQLASDNPVIQVAGFRDAVGLGRKRSIQILEYFDRLGLTRRFGDRRHIRLDNALAQQAAV
ncbi:MULTISPECIES: selenocysteine-specific translation elongation factor [Pseudomonas]|uniref:selenocysteine-specific translation elongation factor n=1 Tax=Pseudomonas TaxID=286 RepID=UPI000B357260|nr:MULTISPECIES: selenocysteine-specific translation elongation factor [Pseudomonas]PMY52690.1 selenocysteine-specific translation elongation factor [Pseudomonas sp. FW305-53]PMY87017.1 selenocysteine-specific translation elongation factor [Pseudomonas sp. FW303-C2]PMY92659.1 selenocysteine-specific translation elongation factor [Pseudomonas sp. FW305-62]PNA45842.1 selenocysteine-specific translation elongation factor [Pseudomonas sp. FW306-2-2C-A10BC]PNA88662.1 selenocysteine-specific transla